MKRFLAGLLAIIMLLATPIGRVDAQAAVFSSRVATGSLTSVTPGYYYLVPVLSKSYALSIMKGSKLDGTEAVLGYSQYMARRVFYIGKSTGYSYTIRNKATGKYIGAENGTTLVGGKIVQTASNTVNYNKWFFIKRGSYYVIQNVLSKRVMGLKDGKTKLAQPVNLQAYGATKLKQRWFLVKYDPSQSSAYQTTTKLKYKTTTKTGMSTSSYNALINMMGACETGGQIYGNRDYYLYQPPAVANEVTVTLGAFSFYGDEAEMFVRRLRAADPVNFKKIDSKGLIARKLSSSGYTWQKTKWHPTSAEVTVLKNLLRMKVSKSVQDKQIKEMVSTLVNSCMAKYTKNTYCIIMYVEIALLGGENAAKRIFDRCKGVYNLDRIMAGLQLDKKDPTSIYQVGDSMFDSRHACYVKWIQQYV